MGGRGKRAVDVWVEVELGGAGGEGEAGGQGSRHGLPSLLHAYVTLAGCFLWPHLQPQAPSRSSNKHQ